MKICSVGRPRPKAAGKARSIHSSRSLKLADWARTPNTTEELGVAEDFALGNDRPAGYLNCRF